MILDRDDSMNKLKAFFSNSESDINTFLDNTLEIPELIKTEDTMSSFQNLLVINNDYIKKIILPNCVQAPYILKGKNLQEVDLSSLERIEFGRESLYNDTHFLLLSFLQNTKIQTLNLPNFKGTSDEVPVIGTTIGEDGAKRASFRDNHWLKTVSMGNKFMETSSNSGLKFNGFWFRNNYSLIALILNYPYVIPIDRTEGFNTTPIIEGNGYIYVPTQELLDAYLASWGSKFASKFRLISNYNNDIKAYNDTITDSWTQIISNCSTNNYGKYNVGDTKTLYWNGIPMQMIIIAKGTSRVHDTKEDGSAAPLTWMLKNISIFDRYNFTTTFGNLPINFNNANGTSEYPGYRSLFTDTIFNGISSSPNEKDSVIQNGIKPVYKYSAGTNEAGEWVGTIRSIETIWPFSASELNLGGNTNPYDYFNDSNFPNRPNFFLGLTTLVSDEKGAITIGTRDYNQNSSYPDLIRSTGKNTRMEVISGDSINSYLIFGFCT